MLPSYAAAFCFQRQPFVDCTAAGAARRSTILVAMVRFRPGHQEIGIHAERCFRVASLFGDLASPLPVLTALTHHLVMMFQMTGQGQACRE